MANVDKVAGTMTKAVSDATSTLDAMNKKAAVDLAKVTKAVQTDQDALSKKVNGLVTGACDKNKVGLVRYNAKTGDMEACGADNKWAKAAAKIEQAGTKTNPAIDCKAVLSARGKPPSGEYYVTVHGAHPKVRQMAGRARTRCGPSPRQASSTCARNHPPPLLARDVSPFFRGRARAGGTWAQHAPRVRRGAVARAFSHVAVGACTAGRRGVL